MHVRHDYQSSHILVPKIHLAFNLVLCIIFGTGSSFNHHHHYHHHHHSLIRINAANAIVKARIEGQVETNYSRTDGHEDMHFGDVSQ